ncbi:hypothetical protein OB920_04535 [Halobacteria archaeon HArc-gm2]|nr:hypothetical protein [Halobacteria archaeon HArc-gm2]
METDDAVEERIDDLAAAASDARKRFDSPPDPPDEDEAMRLVREGFGPTASLFVEIRTGGRSVHLPPAPYDRLEDAMNDWLALYARCYGVELDADYELRNAAQLLVDTHNARDVAQILTGVPERA